MCSEILFTYPASNIGMLDVWGQIHGLVQLNRWTIRQIHGWFSWTIQQQGGKIDLQSPVYHRCLLLLAPLIETDAERTKSWRPDSIHRLLQTVHSAWEVSRSPTLCTPWKELFRHSFHMQPVWSTSLEWVSLAIGRFNRILQFYDHKKKQQRGWGPGQ